MAVVLAMQKWKHYLLGRHFIIDSDQQSLRYLMAQREVATDYQRWMSELMAYDFEIKYMPRTSNKVANALSQKYPSSVECGTLISHHTPQWANMKQEISGAPYINQLRKTIEEGLESPKGFIVGPGVLWYKDRVVIPSKSALVRRILQEYHDMPTGGYLEI